MHGILLGVRPQSRYGARASIRLFRKSVRSSRKTTWADCSKGRTLVLAGVGLGAGAVVSLWAGRLLGSLPFGVSATDPVTFGAMGPILLSVAGLAAMPPAVRAARIRGLEVLRAE